MYHALHGIEASPTHLVEDMCLNREGGHVHERVEERVSITIRSSRTMD